MEAGRGSRIEGDENWLDSGCISKEEGLKGCMKDCGLSNWIKE